MAQSGQKLSSKNTTFGTFEHSTLMRLFSLTVTNSVVFAALLVIHAPFTSQVSAQTTSTWRVIADSRPFNAVWMASATEGWAVATGGGVARTTDGGQTWETVDSGVTTDLNGIWGTASNNVWAVGDNGVIRRWNGSVWSNVASGVTEDLQAIHGNGADNIVAVGLNATAVRWNGTTWSAENLPNGVTDDLYGLWMAGSGVAVAVGERGRILRYNGSVWVSQVSGAGNGVILNAVWGSAGNSVWAVGTGGVVRFWDGSDWSAQTSGITTDLRSVQGSGANSVWATGNGGDMLFFNGTTWSAQTSGTNQDLLGLSVVTASNVVAVGNRRASARWNGTTWTSTVAALPNVAFPAIWSADDDRVWFGGANGVIVRWNGTGFVNTATGTNRAINALWGLDHNNLWAVGSNGTILKWNGSAWSAQTSGVTATLTGIWGVSATQVWAVGANGTILRWNGTAWSSMNSGVTIDLNAVWARDGSNLWAVGQNGTILKGNGSTWTRQTSGVNRTLFAVWGSGSSVWAGGAAATLLKSTGSTWSPQSVGVTGAVNAISGTSATSLWAGVAQSILKSNGSTWSTDGTTGVGLPIAGVFALSPAAVFLSTNSGVLMTNLPAQVPQISAEITGGSAINSGEGTLDFGSVEVTTAPTINVTLRNTGLSNLTGLSIVKDGAQASEFTVTPSLPTELAPSDLVNLTITFTPLNQGTRVANLRIQSSDPTESSFLIRLSGSAFFNPVTITTQPVPIAANLGDDITFTSTATGTETIRYQWRRNNVNVSGATSSSLALNDVSTAQSGTYTVVISNPAGSKTSTAVALTVADAALKTVALPSGATATLSAPAFGTVSSYLWSQNTQPMPADPRYTKWTTKTMQIRSLTTADAAEYACAMTTPGGPLTTRTRLIVYTAKPVVLTPGPTPDVPIAMPDAIVGGTYTPWPVPIDTDETLTPTAYSASGLPAGLTLHKTTGFISGVPNVSLTAARDYLITLTVSNAKGKTTAKAKLTLHPLPPNTTGSYSGAIARVAGFYDNLGGRIDLTIAANASYSGKLTLGGTVLSFRGTLRSVLGDAQPTADIRIPRRNLTELRLTFTVDTPNHRLLNAKVEDTGNPLLTALIAAWRNRWGTLMPDLEAAALQALVGRFNGALFVPDAPSETLPQGNGYLSFAVTSKGQASISGRLADSTAFTCSTFVGPLGEVLCYRALYSNKGSVSGHLICMAGTPGATPPFSDSDLDGITMHWSRPAQNSRTYRNGFSATPLVVEGGRYLAPDRFSPPMERLDDGFTNNASIVFLEGGIEDTFTAPGIPVRLQAGGKVALPPSTNNPRKTKLSIVTSTGLYSGSFSLLDTNPAVPGTNFTRTSTYRGQLVRVGGVLRGYGHFLLAKRPAVSSTEKPTTTDILSGQANLDPL